jgi:hypothetical protein
VFYVPLEDDVVGWDYPRHVGWLRERGVPNVLIRDIGPTAELEAFVKSLRGR